MHDGGELADPTNADGITSLFGLKSWVSKRGAGLMTSPAIACHQAAGDWHLSKAESEDDGKHREGRQHDSFSVRAADRRAAGRQAQSR
jgi:hypothetical protein